jgi:hypothetical protein
LQTSLIQQWWRRWPQQRDDLARLYDVAFTNRQTSELSCDGCGDNIAIAQASFAAFFYRALEITHMNFCDIDIERLWIKRPTKNGQENDQCRSAIRVFASYSLPMIFIVESAFIHAS